ncbi:MAG: metallophosphoesterase family protein [Thermoplasmata archaeon]
MNNRILVISDIHANLEALNAVLEEEFDHLIVLGDLTDYGPSPNEVIEKVRENADFVIMGNHDYANAFNYDCFCSYQFKELSTKSRAYFKPLITSENLEYLKSLKLEIYAENIYMVHASPEDKLYKYLKPEISDADLKNEMMKVNRNLILLGHTHLPMLRHIEGKTVLNPGSVGQPRDSDWRASYAIITDKIELKRVKYDIDTTINKLKSTKLEEPIKMRLIEVLKNGK